MNSRLWAGLLSSGDSFKVGIQAFITIIKLVVVPINVFPPQLLNHEVGKG